jgi:hypothetical protein
MKRILLKSIILGIALHFALAVNILADGFENRGFGENKMQQAVENFGNRNISASGINPGGDPNEGGGPPISGNGPIGPGLGFLSSLGLVYGCFVFLRKRKRFK